MCNTFTDQTQVVVTGSAGRVGRALRAVWGHSVAGLPIVWSARTPGQGIDLVWDIGSTDAVSLPNGAICLHLAGQTQGTAMDLAENRHSACILSETAQRAQAKHVFLMSSVAVYRPGPALITENQPAAPVSAYGHAKRAAEIAAQSILAGSRLTILRLGNLAGADTLLTNARSGPVLLDPVAHQPGGPMRSYIGPHALAGVLTGLIELAKNGAPIPGILNLAQPPALKMADLLTAAGADWRFGAPRPGTVPCVAVDVAQLASLVALPQTSAASVAADMASLRGLWP